MPPRPQDYRVGRWIAIVGIVASAMLATSSIVVGLLTRSTSVVAAGLEFAGDVVASTVVLFGMVIAGRPPDANHPYGHGRIETLAGFVVGMILVAGGAGIGWNSLQAVGEHHPPPSSAAVVVLVVAIGVRGAMSAIKFRIGRRIGS